MASHLPIIAPSADIQHRLQQAKPALTDFYLCSHTAAHNRNLP